MEKKKDLREEGRYAYFSHRECEYFPCHPGADPETLIRHVTEAIADFVQDAPQFDDTTMLCLRYLGYHSDKED